jgi:cytoskeletal protein RodZ
MSVSSPFAEKSGSIMGNFLIPAAAVLGSLVAFGVFSNKARRHDNQHVHTKSVSQTKRPGPLITKVDSVTTPTEDAVVSAEEKSETVEEKSEPVLQAKSLEEPALEEPAVEEPVQQIVPETVVAEVEGPKEMTAEQTFEQYRQAMLHTGPRDMEYQARAEMQSKGGMGNNAMWREQTASLRKSVPNAASLLDELNVSINDRVVSDFNNVRYA